MGFYMKKIQYSDAPKPHNILHKASAFKMPFHMHNELEITLCVSGAESVIAGKSIYSAAEKSLFFFPSNCTHKINTYPDCIYERYVLTISSAWLKNVLGCDSDLHIVMPEPCIVSLTELEYSRIKDLFDNYIKHENNELKRVLTLLEILDNCEKLMSFDYYIGLSPLNNIMQYINENIEQDLRVSDIAKKFLFEPDYLCRLFKEHTHITIAEYINMQRIRFAKELLDSGESIQSVQDKTGFNSYSHFSRIFQRYMDTTPKQYKNKKI